ncbi:MAG: RyR domain-containing protein [Methanobrevibacter sp.]|nr:RyR domain-containing protein [Methanobrevibacter sp.]
MADKDQNDNLKIYIEKFFDELELYDDKYNGHSYKDYFRLAVLNFLENENDYNASEIYRLFFEIYQITGEDKSESKGLNVVHDEPNLMLDLVQTLKKYEENTGELIEKQRDHYIHSVNVFLLGLAIFSQNANYREAFLLANYDKKYGYFYKTKNEEFFYRWGIASLFHDIGYPLEIIGKQMKKFINEGVNFITTETDVFTSKKSDVKTYLSFEDFNTFNTIIKKDFDFPKKYREIYDETNFIDLFKPLDILAHKISLAFVNLDLVDIKDNLDNFVNVMAENGFIDHGFYSAILVMLYYGYLIQKYKKKSEFFFFPIVDSASAILLHNYYRNVLMSKNYKFQRGKLEVAEHPIAYLLILCDELQEWNRKPFGVEDKKKYHANESKIEITDNHMDVVYIIKNGALSPKFGKEKSDFLYHVLDIFDLFNRGLSVNPETEDTVTQLMDDLIKIDLNTPKQVIKNIEELAKKTHDYYNNLRKEQGKEIEFETFEDLPEDMKYSNFRQARSIPNKLNLIGCEIVDKTDKKEEVNEFEKYEIEFLAKVEHDEWVKERESTGWTYAEEKNVEKKQSPYMVPWDKLDDEIKEYDRDPAKNIPKILNSVGMKVVRTNLRILAYKNHEYFIKLMKEEGEKDFTEKFADLSIPTQYSNFKQAENLPQLLDKISYRLISKEDEGIAILSFSDDDVDTITRLQHENWLLDRENHGWTQGVEWDTEKKTNPNLREWNRLSRKMKQINIKVAKKLPKLLDEVGLKIVEK